MLTLRLRFADRPDYELAIDPPDAAAEPWEILRSCVDRDGRISLGDRESCALDDVADVTVVGPEATQGPTWERGLQDEDAETALEEAYDPPR